MICGKCKQHHAHVNDVRACYAGATGLSAPSHHPAPTVDATAPTGPRTADVPAGRYAVPNAEGVLRFYKVDRPTEGRWAGYTFVKMYVSDQTVPVRTGRDDVLRRIAEDPKAAMLRFGQEIGQCGHCGRTLTDEASRAAGIGPVCAGRVWWAEPKPKKAKKESADECAGGKCNGILQQCSKHSAQYQARWGRAANE